jgi:hypothetical protein
MPRIAVLPAHQEPPVNPVRTAPRVLQDVQDEMVCLETILQFS